MMKAVVYKKAFEVGVEEVARPELTHPDDIIVKGEEYDRGVLHNYSRFTDGRK